MDVNEVFGTWTTQRHDYCVPKLEEPIRRRAWSRDPKTPVHEVRQKPYRPLDLHTMRPVAKVPPFDLLWETKEIIRTHPNFTFTPYGKQEDLQKEEVIKTRPRRYISPAVGMDDISDKNIRDLLIKHMYKTTFEAATEPLHLKVTQREVPNTTFEKTAEPISFDSSTIKPIPYHFRRGGKEWEGKQYVSFVDPQMKFWTGYEKDLRKDIEEGLVTDEEKAEIRHLVDKDELRMPYDKLKPKYAGHVPDNVIGPLREQNIVKK